MNFWQRALKSVTRRKGKSFILFLVIFILGNVIAGAVAVQQSTMNVERETKRKWATLLQSSLIMSSLRKIIQENQMRKFILKKIVRKRQKTADYDKVGELDYVKILRLYHDGLVRDQEIQSLYTRR